LRSVREKLPKRFFASGVGGKAMSKTIEELLADSLELVERREDGVGSSLVVVDENHVVELCSVLAK
jgi:hypothetical protein